MSIEDKKWLDLSDGETVLWWDHPHIIHYTGGIASSCMIMLGGIALLFYDIPFITEGLYPLLLVPVGLGFFFWQLLRRANHYYVATNYKIVEKRGIFSRNRDPIHYDRMQDTITDESVAERIISLLPGFNIGDIIISTAATDRAEMVLYDVPDVHQVSQLIADHMREYGSRGPGMRPGGQPSTDHDTPTNEGQSGSLSNATGTDTDDLHRPNR